MMTSMVRLNTEDDDAETRSKGESPEEARRREFRRKVRAHSATISSPSVPPAAITPGFRINTGHGGVLRKSSGAGTGGVRTPAEQRREQTRLPGVCASELKGSLATAPQPAPALSAKLPAETAPAGTDPTLADWIAARMKIPAARRLTVVRLLIQAIGSCRNPNSPRTPFGPHDVILTPRRKFAFKTPHREAAHTPHPPNENTDSTIFRSLAETLYSLCYGEFLTPGDPGNAVYIFDTLRKRPAPAGILEPLLLGMTSRGEGSEFKDLAALGAAVHKIMATLKAEPLSERLNFWDDVAQVCRTSAGSAETAA